MVHKKVHYVSAKVEGSSLIGIPRDETDKSSVLAACRLVLRGK